MKYKVTFEDVIEAETKEQAYDEMVKYCYEVGFNRDVTAFKFKEVTPEALTESVLEDMSIELLEDGE
jgi:hypothetical protein